MNIYAYKRYINQCAAVELRFVRPGFASLPARSLSGVRIAIQFAPSGDCALEATQTQGELPSNKTVRRAPGYATLPARSLGVGTHRISIRAMWRLGAGSDANPGGAYRFMRRLNLTT